MVLKRLEYGKSLFSFDPGDSSSVRKNIAVISTNTYFENSLRFYTENRYWVANYTSVKDIKRKYFDFFIIYRDESMNKESIQKSVSYIAKKYDKPVFIIDSGDELNSLVSLYSTVYIIKKPVDIPYLIHDMEIIGKKMYDADCSRIIEGTLSIESCDENG